ncbi:MAG TPA: pseudouridine synthase [Burkholderiales bacterium]|nr:pseudouridine synthase [Burkholderiales bacterium]
MDVLLFNKPYGVLCQFSRDGGRPCLADYINRPHVYPAGRLDADSEGLVILTADGALQARIADPAHKLPKTYWVQVEGMVDDTALTQLRHGIELGGIMTKPAQARLMDEPVGIWSREPPIRFRKAIPTTWIELILREGKNRQVRRMTAKTGFPTLRLIRAAIGPWELGSLQSGQWCEAAGQL